MPAARREIAFCCSFEKYSISPLGEPGTTRRAVTPGERRFPFHVAEHCWPLVDKPSGKIAAYLIAARLSIGGISHSPHAYILCSTGGYTHVTKISRSWSQVVGKKKNQNGAIFALISHGTWSTKYPDTGDSHFVILYFPSEVTFPFASCHGNSAL